MFFLDSSALVKRYLAEVGSTWVAALCDPNSGNTIVLAAITRVEVAAALASRQRANTDMRVEERERLFRLLFVSADGDLNAAARAEGLPADDPN